MSQKLVFGSVCRDFVEDYYPQCNGTWLWNQIFEQLILYIGPYLWLAAHPAIDEAIWPGDLWRQWNWAITS